MIDLEQEISRYNSLKIRHFLPEEFMCKCGNHFCDQEPMDVAFLLLLDEFRNYTGVPFRVTSGFRCGFHPIEAKKSHPGPHRTGYAADFAFVGASCHEMLYQLGWFNQYQEDQSLRFTGIGLNQKGDHDERFMHLDMCDAAPWRPRPHVWTY